MVGEANESSGLRITTIGHMSVERLFQEMAAETFRKGEVIGILTALVIMLGVFGAVVAALIPLVLAIVAVFTAVGIIAIISQINELNTFTVIVTTMVGLAVGIDYSLLIVQRFREERDRGLERYDAISRAGATASRTVLFSGVAVAIALAGMLIMPDILFKSFGIGAITVVVAAVAAALTLLPALLGLLGDRVNWLTIPIIGRRRPSESAGWFWGAITRVVTAHPVVSVVVTSALLIGPDRTGNGAGTWYQWDQHDAGRYRRTSCIRQHHRGVLGRHHQRRHRRARTGRQRWRGAARH